MEEALARRILQAAIAEGRSAELLKCLIGGGSCTIDDDDTARLVLLSGDLLAMLVGGD